MGYQKYETLSDHIPRSGIYTLTNDLECKKGTTKGTERECRVNVL